MERNPAFGSCLWPLRSNNPSSMNICYKNCQQHAVFLYIVFLPYINIWCYNNNSWDLRPRLYMTSIFMPDDWESQTKLELNTKDQMVVDSYGRNTISLDETFFVAAIRHFLTSCNQPTVFLSACFPSFYYTKKNITIRHEEMGSNINGTSFILKSCFNKID